MSRQAVVHSSQQRYSLPSLELPPWFHRQHEPRSSYFHTIECPCLRCDNIAIACLWVAWLNTDGNDSVLIGSIAQCLAEHSLILRGINDEGDRPVWLQSIYCQLYEGTSHAHHVDELLWVIVGWHWPEAATYAAGHDYNMNIIIHYSSLIKEVGSTPKAKSSL